MNNIPVIKPEWLAGITMTSEQKSKWLAALRSGEYKQQCKGKLYHEGAYCCLGVKAAAVDGNHKPQGMYLNEDSLGPVRASCLQDLLAELNDSGAWSFNQLADFIEANIPAIDERAAP